MQQTGSYVILDANIIISSLLSPGGTSYKAVSKAIRNYRIIEPPRFAVELIEFAKRINMKNKSTLNPVQLTDLLKRMAQKGAIKYITPTRKNNLCRDHKDNDYIDPAIEFQATIITGDKDILVLKNELKKYKVEVLTASEFLQHHPKTGIR